MSDRYCLTFAIFVYFKVIILISACSESFTNNIEGHPSDLNAMRART